MTIKAKVRARVLARSPICRICRKAPATDVDHIWPRSYRGSDDEGNLQAVCHSCNSRKAAQLPPGMLPLYGTLERGWNGWKPTDDDFRAYIVYLWAARELE